MTDTTVKHKDRRATDTRDRILKEAERFYRESGYDGISLQEIANTLDIRKPALFYHFKSKQELFYEMLKEMLEQMHQMLIETLTAARPTSRARLLALLQRLTIEPGFDTMRLLRDDVELLAATQQRTVQQIWESRIIGPLRQIFEEGMAVGELRPLNTELATYMFLNIWSMLPRPNAPMSRQGLGRANPAAFLDQMLDLFLGGLNQNN